jgi:hypothetical protein
MRKDDLHRLAATLETDGATGSHDEARLARAIGEAFAGRLPEPMTEGDPVDSTDALLDLVAIELPSWSLHLSGASATVQGRWTCAIRETGVRDDDELIGVGKAASPAQAVAAALLRVIALRRGVG